MDKNDNDRAFDFKSDTFGKNADKELVFESTSCKFVAYSKNDIE